AAGLMPLPPGSQDAALLVREIRNAGFEPEWCRVETEEAFLEKLNPEIDIVLLDYMMPQFDGLRALKLLEQRKMGIPCILVSASVSETMAVAAIKQGAADYLLKDRLARLGLAVTQAVEKSRLQKERAQAENTVRESEERFRQLAENIEEVFWLTDVTMSQVFYVSPAYEKIWGRLCTDVYTSPRDWLDAVHPQDREKVFAAAIGKEAKNRYDEEYRILRPDGSIRWIHDRAFPVWGADGKVYRLVGVARDITEHKHAEERLRASESQLARSQQLAHLGSWEWDVPSDTVNWSNEMFRIFGMEPGEMKVDYRFVLSRLHPEDRPAFSETIRHAAESGEPYACDCRIVLPDGTARVIHNEGTVISNE
ncbi:MAG: PAS domain-containing protein, partial [Verrucomicrobiota bacterium]